MIFEANSQRKSQAIDLFLDNQLVVSSNLEAKDRASTPSLPNTTKQNSKVAGKATTWKAQSTSVSEEKTEESGILTYCYAKTVNLQCLMLGGLDTSNYVK